MTLLYQLSPCGMAGFGLLGMILIMAAVVLSMMYYSEMREARYNAMQRMNQAVEDTRSYFQAAYDRFIILVTHAWHIPAVATSIIVILFFSVFFMKADVVDCDKNSVMAKIISPVSDPLLSCNCK